MNARYLLGVSKRAISVIVLITFTSTPLAALAQTDIAIEPAPEDSAEPATSTDTTGNGTAMPEAPASISSQPAPDIGAGMSPDTTSSEPDPDPLFGPKRESTQSRLQMQPDPIDGTLTYQYPINGPPGRNGLAPALSLTYSSKNTEHISPFGYGWSINIPYIQRVNKRGLNKVFSQSDFYSTFDGELQATSTTEGVGGSMDDVYLENYSPALASPDMQYLAVASDAVATTSFSSTPVGDLLKGKTPEEQATIKGYEIAKLWSITKQKVGDYWIEIVSMTPIEGGVEVYVRAWDKNNKQLGFGLDGTIELEKVRVINPYIEVPDPVKTIKQYDKVLKKYETIPAPKEDLKAAILLNIGQTISVMKYKRVSNNIVPGKIGRTVTTLQPDSTDGNDTFIGEADLPPTTDVSDDGTNATMYNGDASSFNAHYRSLLKFTGISSLSSDTIVQNVTLTLYESGDNTSTAVNVRRLLRNWSATSSTWTNYSPGNAWTSSGASSNGNDRISATSTAYSSNATASGAINLSGSTLISDVQSWIDGSASNYGWLISAENAENTGTTPTTYVAWRTSNHGTASERPKLVIEHPNTDASCAQGVNDVGYGALSESGDFRVYQFMDGCYWKMTDKNGTIYTFGATSTAKIVDSRNASSTYQWLLQEVRDRNDNYISYSYFKDSGQVYPDSIKYTGNGSTDGIYEINFVRESRTDVATSSAMGFPIASRYRISEIQIKVNGTWQRKYILGYGTGSNGRKSLLTSITESGKDEDGTTTTLPATTFAYTTKDADWAFNSSWKLPTFLVSTSSPYNNADWGSRFDDFNGDGWQDFAWYRTADGSSYLFTNNADGTWSTTTPSGYSYFVNDAGGDYGGRIIDVDGDALSDFLGNGTNVAINTNRGGSFATTTDWMQPVDNVHTGSSNWDDGARILDINGDGLPDFVKSYSSGSYSSENGIYLNNGRGWDGATSTSWAVPSGVYFAGPYSGVEGGDYGARFADFNGDGLVDIISSTNSQTKIYFNDGDGSWTSVTPSGFSSYVVDASGRDQGVRIADVNADGLADVVDTVLSGGVVYFNQGGGTFTGAGWSAIEPDFVLSNEDVGARFADVNADGLLDIARGYGGTLSPAGSNGVYLANGTVPDLLASATNDAGGSIYISYKPSTEYMSGSTKLNPQLPLVIQTVNTIQTNNAFGTTGTTTYSFTGGEYYYANEYDRKFAGYATTTITDPIGNITNIYSHQGNGSQSSIGEYSDSKAKIGKPFRTEIYDGNNNLYAKKIDKWDSASLSNDRVYVKNVRTTEFAYDGDSDHKDKATTYAFDDMGNLSAKTELGEVNGSDDGSYTDTGSDTRTTTYAYATSTAYGIYGLPMTEVFKNHAGTRVAQRNIYYDSLALGSVEKGNLTKEEKWISGSEYASSTKAYNSYGLVTSKTDPRSKTTTYSYDSASLFIATSTNPLGHVTEYYRDMTSGRPKKIVDPNGLSFETVFDGLDRVVTEKIPDHLGTPSNTVTKTTYSYTDTASARRVARTDYLNSATSTDTYTYLDGFLRPIQERKEVETTYVARDKRYDGRGDVSTESLPYESSGTSRTAMTTSNNLLIAYGYDPLRRATSTTNVLGAETYAYDQWSQTITDRNANTRDLTSDAFGNLAQVDEHNATSTYTTVYAYDALGNLTKITDSLSNVRNFTYDGLSRLTNSEDLHASGDGTFGSRAYSYDLSGNIASTTDAKSQTLQYTYDDINRVLTEDYTGSAGTEIQYGYDTCTYGKGLLCAATTTNSVSNLAYDALGNVSSEQRTIDSASYTTTFTRDRLNNLTNITYPNGREAKYVYSDAGQLEQMLSKPSGGSYVTVIEDFDYAPAGQTKYKRFGNNIGSTYTYDEYELWRLKSMLTDTVPVGGFMEYGLIEEFPLIVSAEQPVIDTASTNGEIIAALGPLPKERRGDYYIEITGMVPMQGGVEVFVKAWDSNNKPIGFGMDGTVEIERIRVFDPYIEVPDYTTTRKQYDKVLDIWEDIPGAKEDAREAILTNIAHTISVMKTKHDGTNIIEGKVGHTVSTFQPDATDGRDVSIGRANLPPWTDVSDDGTNTSIYVGDASSFDAQYRSLIKFTGLSSIPSTDTIASTTLTLYESGDNVTTTVSFRRLLQNWVEGQANWTVYSTGNNWIGAGASSDGNDRIATTSDSYGSNGSASGAINLNGSGLLSDVTGWVAGTNSNYGWLISATGAELTGTTPTTHVSWRTSNHGTASERPKLVVEHSAPASGDPGTIQNLNYTYDDVGNITQLADYSTSTAKVISYGYDTLYRLTSASTTAASSTPYSQTYTYNAIGNITNKSDVGAYTYSSTGYQNPHAPVTVNGVTYSYDNNGNLTGFGNTSYTWDYRDRLTQVATGTATSTYAYDHQNQRVWQKVLGSATTTYTNRYYSVTSGASSTAYIYAGDVLVAFVDTGTTTSNTTYVHPDHLGSTHVTTNASGVVVQVLDYYPFGSLRINSSSGGADTKKKYVGTEFDSSSGLNYMSARYEDPQRGQFLSEDQSFLAVGNPNQLKQVTGLDQQAFLSDPQLQNSYAYARSNPLTLKDPEGKFVVQAIMLALRIYSAYTLGFSGGEVLNAKLLFPNDYTSDERGSAYFRFGENVVTGVAGFKAKNLFEHAVVNLGPDAVDLAERFRIAGPQNPNSQIPYNLLQQYTSSYPGLSPSLQQMFWQIQSPSIQQRYQATQSYNAATGATGSGGGAPSANSLWVTPSGAVVNFGGQVVSAPPSTPPQKKSN